MHDPLTGVGGSIWARRGAGRLVPAGCFGELDGWRAGEFSRFDAPGKVEEDWDAKGHYGAAQEECRREPLLVDDEAAGDRADNYTRTIRGRADSEHRTHADPASGHHLDGARGDLRDGAASAHRKQQKNHEQVGRRDAYASE